MQPFDETKLSAIQRKAFESMSEREKDLVRKGRYETRANFTIWPQKPYR